MAIVPEFLQAARDLNKVRALEARISHPYWMPHPDAWIWTRPDGMAQGFAPLIYSAPGLCNLLWLAMDHEKPPQYYDALSSALYMLLVVDRSAKLLGEPLKDVAGLLSLRQFYEALPETSLAVDPVEHAYPLLRRLAARRLQHAHT